MKVVVIAGFYRTGSTWLFNATKTILKLSGRSVIQSGGLSLVSNSTGADYCLHKVHPFSLRLSRSASLVLTSERDLSEVRESYQRFMGKPFAPKVFDSTYSDFKKWRAVSGYNMEFDQLKKDPRPIIESVASALGVPVNVDLVLQALKQIRPPKSGHSTETFYFSNHITREIDNPDSRT